MPIKPKPQVQVEYLPISSLSPNPKNPRIHSKRQVRQLMASIERFGFNVPVIIDGSNQLVAGHGRMLAALELGIAELPAIRLEHLTDAEVKAYMIADNKLTENAAWDEPLLASFFIEIDELNLDFNLDITGFEMAQIDFLMDDKAAKQDAADKVPPLQATAIAKPGDIWQLGQHRILCGDSLDEDNFQKLLGKHKARLVFTDPPYNVRINGHVSGLGKTRHREFEMAAGEMSRSEFTAFLKKSFTLLAQFSTSGAIHYVCMDWRHAAEILEAGQGANLELKNICVWCKDNGGMGTFYRSQHEMVFVFKSGKAQHINNFELGQHGRYRTNVWNYPGASSFARNTEEGNTLALHPTVKPVALVADAIKDCSKRRDIILDPFLGSGSTLIAAEKTGRRCFGLELDPLYVDTIIRRWQNYTGEVATHVATGKSFIELARKRGKHA